MPDMQLTRRDIYLSAIVAGSSSVPDPYTREECYLAKIAGKSVSIPEEPITQYEMYLAKLAGQDVSVPVPQVTSPRLFFFLYAACGNDIALPVPVTWEEMLWQQYIDANAGDDITELFTFTQGKTIWSDTGEARDNNSFCANLNFVDISEYTMLKIMMPVGTSTVRSGLSFYTGEKASTYIEGSGTPRPVGSANGVEMVDVQIPDTAKCVRTIYWKAETVEERGYDPFVCIGIK